MPGNLVAVVHVFVPTTLFFDIGETPLLSSSWPDLIFGKQSFRSLVRHGRCRGQHASFLIILYWKSMLLVSLVKLKLPVCQNGFGVLDYCASHCTQSGTPRLLVRSPQFLPIFIIGKLFVFKSLFCFEVGKPTSLQTYLGHCRLLLLSMESWVSSKSAFQAFINIDNFNVELPVPLDELCTVL